MSPVGLHCMSLYVVECVGVWVRPLELVYIIADNI